MLDAGAPVRAVDGRCARRGRESRRAGRGGVGSWGTQHPVAHHGRVETSQQIMTDLIIYSSVSQVRLLALRGAACRSEAPAHVAHLVARLLPQGERVLAECTAKSGNYINVVQRILKNLPPHDNEVTYWYGE